jgi:hypothetical protein
MLLTGALIAAAPPTRYPMVVNEIVSLEIPKRFRSSGTVPVCAEIPKDRYVQQALDEAQAKRERKARLKARLKVQQNCPHHDTDVVFVATKENEPGDPYCVCKLCGKNLGLIPTW